MNEFKLTEKEKKFCEEYLVDSNATQAAIRAGYSKKSAYSIGSENLRKDKIQEYLNQLRQARKLRTQITADKIFQELATVAFADKDVKSSDKLKALGILAKYVCKDHNSPDVQNQPLIKDVSKFEPIEHKNYSVEFYLQVIENPKITARDKLTARKQLDHLLGLDQQSIIDPEETAAKFREALDQMDKCLEESSKLSYFY